MGQHLSRLEFLRILLGNEPVLAPPERLYRQLLAGEASDAARDLDDRLESSGFVKYLDEVAVPCQRIASSDRRRGVLAADQLADLKQTLDDYVFHVRELLDFRREQRHIEGRGASMEPPPQPQNASALVIAGRGILDQVAAELVADVIRFRHGIPVQCPSLGGLTGIGAAADTTRNDLPEFVVLVSVGEVTPTQLDLLLSRIRRIFIKSTIVLGDWGGRSMTAQPRDSEAGRVETTASLVDTIGRLAAERAANQPPRLELV